MKFLINLKDKKTISEVINEILITIHIEPSDHIGFDGFADWIGSVASESEIWRDKIQSIQPSIKSIYPNEQIVEEKILTLSNSELLELKTEAIREVNKLGLFEGDKYYDVNLNLMTNSIIFKKEEQKYWDEMCTLDPTLKELYIVLYNISDFKKCNPYTVMQKYDSAVWETHIINGYEVSNPKLRDIPVVEERNDYITLIDILERKKDPKQRADKVLFTYEIWDGEIN